MSSIYVNIEGEWRLGGFEYVWKTKDITKTLLDLVKPYRYTNAIDKKNEYKNDIYDGLEQYAFGIFCEELLKNRQNSNTPYIHEFYEYCLTHLKHSNITMRPKLSAILLHPYFNHEFILIHSFLNELPLKGPQEKQDFFTGLIDRLRYFDENMIASQIGNLLLSRMVLLDTTAQLCVIPYVLKTKTDISTALFSQHTFIKYIIPHIKKIFCVRDVQIRLILLEYFNNYVKLMPEDELQDQILPNLLLGIKDINDVLVAKTLRCLADLVPILGSKIVIGGNNRKRLFADGRPQGIMDNNIKHWIEPRSITPVMTSGEYIVSASPLPSSSITTIDNNNDTISESFVSMTGIGTENTIENLLIMSERLSPDGGEDIQTAATDGGDIEEEDAWSDWENDDIHQPIINTNDINNSEIANNASTTELAFSHSNLNTNIDDKTVNNNESLLLQSPLVPEINQSQHQQQQLQYQNQSQLDVKKTQTIEQQKKSPSHVVIDDINALDIKNQKFKTKSNEEVDFFKDMEPIIQSTSNLLLQDNLTKTSNNNNKNGKEEESRNSDEIEIDKSRFAFNDDNDNNVETTAWDDDDGDWGV